MSDVDEYIEPNTDWLLLECSCGNGYYKREGSEVDNKLVCGDCVSEGLVQSKPYGCGYFVVYNHILIIILIIASRGNT